MNPWWELLQKILAEWREESGNAQQSPCFIIEYIYESLAMHQRLAALKPGDPIRAAVKGNHINLHDAGGRIVARLSRSACETWQARLPSIERITVLAMVQRLREDCDGEYKQRCRCEQWEIPLAEIAYLAG